MNPFTFWTALAATMVLVVQPFRAQTFGEDFPISPAMRTEVIEGLAKHVGEQYFSVELADRMVRHLRSRASAGAYDGANTAAKLAEMLVADLREISRDGHLNVSYSQTPYPPPPSGPPPAGLPPAAVAFFRYVNASLVTASRLPGNVGYIRIDGWAPPDILDARLAAAMTFIADTDALLVDLRYDRSGGSPDAVALFCSYLLNGGIHLNDLVLERGRRVIPSFTREHVSGPKYLEKPVYVLQAAEVFSAPEEFAYDLQTQRRATIVGETTRGGANPAAAFRINDHFLVIVPIGEARNPITGRNWEGTGVSPDLPAKAEHALDVAHLAALITILQGNDNLPEFARQEIRKAIRTLTVRFSTEGTEVPASLRQTMAAVVDVF